MNNAAGNLSEESEETVKNVSTDLENTHVVMHRMVVEISTLQGSESSEEHIREAGETVILF